jgi:hypothetical protein
MRKVIDNIRRSLAENPRPIQVIYAHPMHEWVLGNAGWLVKDGAIETTNIMGRYPVTTTFWHNKPDYDYKAAPQVIPETEPQATGAPLNA